MTLTHSELTFNGSAAMLIFSLLVFAAALFFSFVTWKRNHYSKPIAWLELLRLLALGAILITLNQPEWKQTFEPNEKPVFAILTDASGSMNTVDMVTQQGSAEKVSRREIAQPFSDPLNWEALTEDYQLVVQSFGNNPNKGTNISAALSEIAEDHPHLRGALLVSDGDWNTGEPPSHAATQYRLRNIPIFTHCIGEEARLPDLEVTAFDVPTFGIAGKPIRLPFTISSAFPKDIPITATFTDQHGESITTDLTIPAMGKTRQTLQWTPSSVGDYDVSISIPPLPEEFNPTNNTLSASISIRKEELNILLIDSFPRWEYRYLRNALERDPGVSLKCLLYHPSIAAVGAGPNYLDQFPEADQLSSFDVIILGDVGLKEGQLDTAQVTAIKQHVATQAAGLVLIPGFRGNQFSLTDTELNDLFPVTLDPEQIRGWGSPTPGQFELTELGARSLLTRLEDTELANTEVWASLPGFQWFAGVLRARPGSEILATHSSETNQHGHIPLIVTRTYGTGKILFMGTDGAWRWRKGVEDKYHYRFWGQVARWMAYQRQMASDEFMRLFYSPDRPTVGDILTFNANVMDLGGEPLQSANVSLQIIAPSGKVEAIQLNPSDGEQWGLFSSSFEPQEAGDHQLVLTCEENGGTLELDLNVQATAIEKIGEPARPDVLAEIAALSRGEIITEIDPASILSKITALHPTSSIEKRLRIWSHPGWIGAIILFLTLFWIGRKMSGLV